MILRLKQVEFGVQCPEFPAAGCEFCAEHEPLRALDRTPAPDYRLPEGPIVVAGEAVLDPQESELYVGIGSRLEHDV